MFLLSDDYCPDFPGSGLRNVVELVELEPRAMCMQESNKHLLRLGHKDSGQDFPNSKRERFP